MGGEKRSRRKVDWLSNLPESLRFQVLLKLGTKDVVKCSALSSRWRNLWKCIPKLDLKGQDFYDPLDCVSKYERCVSFVDRFLGESVSSLESFKLVCPGDGDGTDNALIWRWMDTVIKRKVKHLEYIEDACDSDEFQIPPNIYTCESLVSLRLWSVTMSTPEFVSLPSLQDIDLIDINFPEDLAIEKLILGCLVLKNLAISRKFDDGIQVLRVCSQSLLSFTLDTDCDDTLDENILVVIDAPTLEYLMLTDHRTASFIIKNPASLAKVNIDVVFCLNDERRFDPADLPKRYKRQHLLRQRYDHLFHYS